MSTREQRQAFQDFREKHGVTKQEFEAKWRAMFNREPQPHELQEFLDMRKKLMAPLGRTIKKQIREAEVTHEAVEQVPVVTITKRYEWDMAHRLPYHGGKCHRLHGHRYVAEVDLTGPVLTAGARSGMVADFYDVKKMLDDTIGQWDHKTMLWSQDRITITAQYESDEQLGIFRVPFMPTAENIAAYAKALIENWLTQSVGMPKEVLVTRVRIYETPSGWAEVR